MKVLVIGGGGREHAIVWKLKQSPLVSELLCAPGNAGIAELARCFPEVGTVDIDGIVAIAKSEAVDFVVVAPDDPLALGCVDRLEAENIPAFGPCKAAARLEYSKRFSKDFMARHGIPAAAYKSFSKHRPDEAISYIKAQNTYPIVIKADGLALGKGVIIALNEAEAVGAVEAMFREGKFGASGDEVVIEEYMDGIEATLLCFVDGATIATMPASQDHKRAFDDDKGPNTGGMGAFAPSVAFTEDIARRVEKEILKPTMDGLAADGIVYKGVLYVELMLTKDGPKVIEYNSRFGDPEAQALLPLLDSDLMEIFIAVREGRLSEIKISWRDAASCCVVIASGGYPGKIETGFQVGGFSGAKDAGGIVFHAGTKPSDTGEPVTSGGRVLGVTAVAPTLDEAIEKAYAAVSEIHFEKMHYRRDIGKRR